MSGIKSLADEIREKLRLENMNGADNDAPPADPLPDPDFAERPLAAKVMDKPPTKAGKRAADPAQAKAFFELLDAFEYKGTQKSMIRVDARTMNVLKRLKLANGIDMNKFIVYSLHQFLSQHPWLASYIQETLKNSDI